MASTRCQSNFVILLYIKNVYVRHEKNGPERRFLDYIKKKIVIGEKNKRSRPSRASKTSFFKQKNTYGAFTLI